MLEEDAIKVKAAVPVVKAEIAAAIDSEAEVEVGEEAVEDNPTAGEAEAAAEVTEEEISPAVVLGAEIRLPTNGIPAEEVGVEAAARQVGIKMEAEVVSGAWNLKVGEGAMVANKTTSVEATEAASVAADSEAAL